MELPLVPQSLHRSCVGPRVTGALCLHTQGWSSLLFHPEGSSSLTQSHQVLQTQRRGGSGATPQGAGAGRPEGSTHLSFSICVTVSLFVSFGFMSCMNMLPFAESTKSSSDTEVHCSGGLVHQHCRYLSSPWTGEMNKLTDSTFTLQVYFFFFLHTGPKTHGGEWEAASELPIIISIWI